MKKLISIDYNREKLVKVAKKYDLMFVVLFGSKARGEHPNAESDIDIAVLPSEESDYELFKNLFSEFSDIFRGENVDVRFLEGGNLLFRYEVVKDGILLAGNEKKYENYKLSIIKSYSDDKQKYLPFLEKRLIKRQEYLEGTL